MGSSTQRLKEQQVTISLHVLGLALGRCGSFLTAQNVIIKLTFESQRETPPPNQLPCVTLGEETKRELCDLHGKQVETLLEIPASLRHLLCFGVCAVSPHIHPLSPTQSLGSAAALSPSPQHPAAISSCSRSLLITSCLGTKHLSGKRPLKIDGRVALFQLSSKTQLFCL